MSLGHGVSVVRSGLVFHLDAANKKSYAGSGSNITNIANTQNTGTLVNGTTFSSGNSGGFSFDGVDDYINTTYDMTGKINVTFQAWLRVSSYPPNSSLFDAIFDQSTGSNGCLLRIQSNGILNAAAFNSSGAGLGAASPLVVPLNTWKMVTVSFENNKINYHLDLQNAFITPTTGVLDIIKADVSSKLRIGTTTDGNALYNNFHGIISTIMIYEKVLTTTEVIQNFEATRGRYGI